MPALGACQVKWLGARAIRSRVNREKQPIPQRKGTRKRAKQGRSLMQASNGFRINTRALNSTPIAMAIELPIVPR